VISVILSPEIRTLKRPVLPWSEQFLISIAHQCKIGLKI
jgi:hypothetical protein